MRQLFARLLLLTLLSTVPSLTWGCGLAQADTLDDVRDVAHTVDDAATILCELFAADHPEESASVGSPSDWCAIHDNVKPFIDQVLAAQQRIEASRSGASAAAFPAPGAAVPCADNDATIEPAAASNAAPEPPAPTPRE